VMLPTIWRRTDQAHARINPFLVVAVFDHPAIMSARCDY
jgi:hypothetical protein